MAKVVFIGAGSLGFTRKIVNDLLHYDSMAGVTIGLVDIHEERLAMAERACRKIIDEGGYEATIEASTERKEVLKGADAVLITILSGDTSVWRHDIEIPKKYGVDFCVGDTRGVSGIFRALRTIPVMVDICRDVERLCPAAIVLNYTNPMAMLCNAMQSETSAKVTGLCHSVQGTARKLARWADVPFEELDYKCAGLNHLSWYLKLERAGRDLYPAIRARVEEDEAIYREEPVRNDLFKMYGYYVTESSGHNSEYSWWFRKRPELIEYYSGQKGLNSCEHAYILKHYRDRENTWKDKFTEWLENPDWSDSEKKSELLKRSNEYASAIINAHLGGESFRFNGNVPNEGIISNLPEDCCVEVPVVASRNSLDAIHVGPLPRQVVPLTSLTAQVERMTVVASMTGDPTLVLQAVAQSPLTAACLSLAEIKNMVNDLLEVHKDYLPRFKDHKV